MSTSSEPSPRHGQAGAPSSPPRSEPTLGSAERALLGALAGAPPVDPRRLGLLAGDRLGRYEIVRELGRGGMGVVFLARDTLLERDVALKVLDPSAGSGTEVAARIVREARASSRLAHPSIARVFDVGDDAGLVFLAMEHVPGATLRTRIREPRPIAAREVAAIGAAMAQALAVAHRAGIVHRDLKPENVILGDDGRVCVVDFGLAQTSPDRRRAASARSGRPPRPAAGTPGYVAPELADGARPDERSDLFSLGVVLRELLAKVAGATRDAAAVRRVADRLLEADPARRYVDGDAVAAALAPLARERPSRARRAMQLGAAVVVLGASVAGALLLRPRDPAANVAPSEIERVTRALSASPLVVAPPRMACPPFAAAGVARPRVWLGAAAANLACQRLAMMLGDPETPPASPARLLGAAAAPVETDPEIDPWGDDAVREAALASARRDAGVILDGEVESVRGGFRVSLELVATTPAANVGTARGGRGSAWHRDLAVAVASALDEGMGRLGGTGEARLGEPARKRFGVDDRVDLLALDDLRSTFETYASLDDAWIRAGEDGDRGGPLALALRRRLAALVEPPSSSGRDEVAGDDDTDPVSLTARADAMAEARKANPPADPRIVADALGVEATLRAKAGDAEASRRLSLAALAINPETGPWETLVEASYARSGFGSVGRAYATWHPEASDAYNVMSQDARASRPELRTRLLERAYLLSSAAPLYAGNYGRTLLLADRREEARAVAARLHTGSEMQGFAGDRLDAEIQLSEGRVAASFATLLDLLRRIPSVGSVERGDAVALGIAAEVAHLLGREDELAELVAARFVRDEPRIVGGSFAAQVVVQACVLARPALARPCVERIAELDASGHFREGATPDGAPFLRGALLWVRGDAAGAAAAFRSLGGRVGFGQRALVARALEAVGDLDAASTLDDPATTRGLFGGVSPSDARAAIRAHRRGDPRAREMARRVLDAWAGADARLAPTAELEAIAR